MLISLKARLPTSVHNINEACDSFSPAPSMSRTSVATCLLNCGSDKHERGSFARNLFALLSSPVSKIKTMSLVTWLRGKARTTVDGVFCSSSPDIKWVGNEHSGWVISVNPPPRVAYCAGVG